MDLIYHIAVIVHGAWIWAAFVRMVWRRMGWRPDKVATFLFFELRPVFVPAVVIHSAIDIALYDFDALVGFSSVGGLVIWWVNRHDKDDDDRWKRRREKLSAKVEQVGGKLTVTPVGSPA